MWLINIFIINTCSGKDHVPKPILLQAELMYIEV